ncbi:MAG: heme NO-binding domain-containing protein [Flavobacteriales bacterium]|nr:heme NO-binding domain-containing protein [Flavobacteriales bacterium]
MKGIVFTELIEMIENEFSFKIADDIIQRSNLKSKGVYSSIGTYDHKEIFILVKELSDATGISSVQLFRVYGEHLFGRFKSHYPSFFENVSDPLSFLELVDSYIHKEVLKLYPDAQLPSFVPDRIAINHLKMTYSSQRGMSDFAHGLILGCFKNFGKRSEIEMEKISESEVVFNIKQLD